MRPSLPELSGHELLAEWRKVMDAATGSLGGHVAAPHELLETMRRQLELVQELINRERRLQSQAADQLLAPIDAAFNLLEASGETLRKQAEALDAAGQALEQSARLVTSQAELFERAIGALREPTDRARAAVGIKPRTDHRARRRSGRRA